MTKHKMENLLYLFGWLPFASLLISHGPVNNLREQGDQNWVAVSTSLKAMI